MDFSFYPQRDQNANEIFDDNAGDKQKDAYYYENCDSSVWMRSCEQEVIEPLRSNNVTGNVPKWLKGTLLRNGPGNLKVGEYRFQHLFDSSALLHRYEFYIETTRVFTYLHSSHLYIPDADNFADSELRMEKLLTSDDSSRRRCTRETWRLRE